MMAGMVDLGDGCKLLQVLRGSCLPPLVLQLRGQAGEGCRGRRPQWHCSQGQGMWVTKRKTYFRHYYLIVHLCISLLPQREHTLFEGRDFTY